VLDEFKRVLARVQRDYGFYVDCQANPAAALAPYDLTQDERVALTNPATLADVLRQGIGVSPMRIMITIKGRHDWVNRAATGDAAEEAERESMIAHEVDTIKRANVDGERTQAAVRLMGLIG